MTSITKKFLRYILCCLILYTATNPTFAKAPLQADDNSPIPMIQGQGDASPIAGQRVDTVGIVTGVLDNGFYLQDPTGDGDPMTSDGLLVYTGRRPKVELGECVQVERALVDEYYEKTELTDPRGVGSAEDCPAQSVEAASIPPAQLRNEPQALFEQYEGMLVQLPSLSGVVQGPTKRFSSGDVELAFVPEQLAAHLDGGMVFRWQPDQVSALMYLSNELGQSLPELDWGERFTIQGPTDGPVQAILDYNFGKYQLLLLPGHEITVSDRVEEIAESTLSRSDEENEFSVCTFNVLGLGQGTAQYRDDDEYADQLQKRALTIAQELHGCTIIGLQETGKPDDVENLANLLREEFSLDYDVTAIKGPNTSSFEFPLTNSFLTLRDRVTVHSAELRQGCSRLNYDVRYMPRTCDRGTFGLFSRPPLTIDVTVKGAWGEPYELTVINNHWKSKGGNEEVNVVRREAQANHVASIVQERLAETPNARVIVLGDLNDFPDSKPVDVLLTAPEPDLIPLLDFLPMLDHYTYIFNGAHQVLDHIMATPSLLPDLAGIWPIHINADFAYPAITDPNSVHHSSDHDPVVMRVQPQGIANFGGQLGFEEIQINLWPADASTTDVPIAQTTTDDLGEYRFWDLAPGPYQISYKLPDHLTLVSELTQAQLSITLEPGFTELAPIQVEHATIQSALSAALVGPYLGQNLVHQTE